MLRVVTRAEMRAGRLRHRCVYLAVVWEGRLLVHRRSDAKDVFPGWWDVAAGGVVGAGEGWEAAARRELAEELGVSGDLVALGDVDFDDEHCRLVGRAYLVEHPGPFTFADGEVVEARWATRAEAEALDPVCTDSRAVVLPLVVDRLR